MVSQSAVADILAAYQMPMDVRSIADALGIEYNDNSRTDITKKATKLVKYGIAVKIEGDRIQFTITNSQEESNAGN
jgi:hypothetical protein